MKEYDATRREIEESRSLLAFYDRKSNTFTYHDDLLEYLGRGLNGKRLWDYLAQAGYLSRTEALQIEEICGSMDETNSFFARYFQPAGMSLHAFIFIWRGAEIIIALKDLTPDIAHTESCLVDELTGLLSRSAYCAQVEQLLAETPDRPCAVFFFDVARFKAVNERFGVAEGDKLLRSIASKLKTCSPHILCACRISADRFAFLADVSDVSPDDLVTELLQKIEDHHLPYEISCNVGIYRVCEGERTASRMLDKAKLAQTSVKGSYTKKIGYYSDTLRDQMLSEQEITGSMNAALKNGQFVIYYQPQYDHATGMVVGAEALVRWNHPEKGLISPGIFVPIFEKNGFITQLDRYVFEQVCQLLHRARLHGEPVAPISINFSADDIYAQDFVDGLESIRARYDVPASLLRIELTERLLINHSAAVNAVFHELHARGYLIELDDFGCGYSSLNVLKDLDVDVIKLDMLFLANQSENSRGGIILAAVVNMAKGLNMSVIAEGVETPEQTGFLRGIGCSYMQGYLYARPLPEADYEKLLRTSQIGALLPPENPHAPQFSCLSMPPAARRTADTAWHDTQEDCP